MKKTLLSTAILGLMITASFSFTSLKGQSPEAQRGNQDTLGTEMYKNQVEIPIVRDSVPIPMPDSMPVPDSFPPPPPPPVPDSIPQ